MKNPTGIKLCRSHKIKWPLAEDPHLKVTVLMKAVIRITYNKMHTELQFKPDIIIHHIRRRRNSLPMTTYRGRSEDICT